MQTAWKLLKALLFAVPYVLDKIKTAPYKRVIRLQKKEKEQNEAETISRDDARGFFGKLR